MMKITNITAIPMGVPVSNPINLAYGALSIGAHIVVKIETDEGITGYGETSPTRGWYPETQESTITYFQMLTPILVGKNPLDIGRLVADMDKVQEGWCAKAALDLALHDLAGKILGIPAYQLLGGSFYDELSVLEMDLSIQGLDETAKAARDGWEAGARSFEIKMGLDPVMDVERVRVVREAVGPAAKLRADMNEGYNLATAKVVLAKLEPFGLEYVEQPLPAWNKHGMAELARQVRIPLCADQSAYTPQDVGDIIKMGAADYICIKVARGGLWKSRSIASLCDIYGISCTLGSMLPLGIGARAIHHFAKATKNVALDICGSYGSPLDFYAVDILKNPIEVRDGVIQVPDKPGLGVEVDEEMVNKYAIKL